MSNTLNHIECLQLRTFCFVLLCSGVGGSSSRYCFYPHCFLRIQILLNVKKNEGLLSFGAAAAAADCSDPQTKNHYHHLERELEASGMKFGAHQNAYTAFHETVRVLVGCVVFYYYDMM